jgi:predicted dehydrogenase
MRKAYQIAVIGCGYWGVNYVRVFNELPGAEVIWICDKNRERLNVVGSRWPGAKRTDEAREVLEDPQLDALVISTPATDHYEIARAGLKAGRHLLVEKPLTASSAESAELVELARQQELVLMVGHTFLFNAGICKVKELITAEDFGAIHYLHATRTNLGPIRQDVNAIWDLAPHDVSIFAYLLDADPLWVSAVGSRLLGQDKEDVGFATLAYHHNILANIHVSWLDPNKVREVVVVGSRKRIVFDDLNNLERVRIYEKGVSPAETDVDSFGEFRFLVRDGDIISPKVEVSEPLKNQCQHFLDCLANGKTPLSDGYFGWRVVRTMEAIQRSIEQHGAPVEVERS